MVFGYFGSLFYIGLLFTNAIAILNEERFLARSASMHCSTFVSTSYPPIRYQNTVGWSTRVPSTANAGFGHSPAPQMFDTAGFGGASGSEGAGVKAKLVNLIGATRTLMRIPLIVVNIGVIIYEVLLG
ncbi:hypothetical protein I307_02779 [Cryptococcus deuterogattii 99/473]|uniref:Protein transport protein YOS1 n=1 Tax=Cryptococcus deuterogattii Ram5 TaxID=1296110 RepID=A0A0D0V1A2_9TREE|nr:hypothetical protein I309_03179 [Cryptococcus deuterogattii LA55]KIR35426.1 hypothetical protein I352_01701 [Cryptococcus deuterogattii MMRL2647]KIR38695.1 hypothetical protein I313_05333 [Cryptococcus deuterogattii Ram5]KIR70880.1 hypothetical protein I310_05292 [Cryptococcus deuterogattii CA1014]KIR90491.1 hypothetical protein I304_05633 [Cryptococcus deuterogattii CBS 10090]KIR97224.1 hypothetical protein L804_05406 [Cryptococcus deuterogattii 2001/935-1]KIY57706.1 hypothetical protein 